jgi:hypothetical protein
MKLNLHILLVPDTTRSANQAKEKAVVREPSWSLLSASSQQSFFLVFGLARLYNAGEAIE